MAVAVAKTKTPFLYLRVYVPLSSEKLANEGKFAFCAAGELSDGSAVGPVGVSLRRRSEGKEELIEQSDNLAEAWPHVWVLHPTRLHYERQTRRYPLWHSRPLLLQCLQQEEEKRLISNNKSIITREEEDENLERCCVGGLQVGHALKWHTISEKLP